ncbi:MULTISPECIES: gliding motility-associated C-terminal domain-containing protein [unclassified Myroides]|uniref:T9SS type B sorting domain-containing protein n=1 Tax=unclassified Myroides TaxID=2642485 RepID=UPI003D2F704F
MKNNQYCQYTVVFLFLIFSTMSVFKGYSQTNPGSGSSTSLQDPNSICSQVFTELPFVELFSDLSPTLGCWRAINNNNDRVTWEIPQVNSTTRRGNVGMVVNPSNPQPDDWLISPRIRVNGNQRVRFSYFQPTPNDGPQIRTLSNMQIRVSKLGSVNNSYLIEEFVYEVTYRLLYSDNIGFQEMIFDLVDHRTGIPISGDINIAFHMVDNQYGRSDVTNYFVIDNFVVEDIPSTGTFKPAVDLPYETGFEEENDFNLWNDFTDQWTIGPAVNNGGENAMYITNDGGVSNDYTLGAAQASHAFIDINIPPDRNTLHVDFDLRSLGFEGQTWNDYFSTGFLLWLFSANEHNPVARIPYLHYRRHRDHGWSGFATFLNIYADQHLKDPPAEFERITLSIPWEPDDDMPNFIYNGIRGGTARLDFEFVSGIEEEKRVAVAIDNLNIYTSCTLDIESRESNPDGPRPFVLLDYDEDTFTPTSFSIQDIRIRDSVYEAMFPRPNRGSRSLLGYRFDVIISPVPVEDPDNHPLTFTNIYLGVMVTGLDPMIRNYHVYFRPLCISDTGEITYGEWDYYTVRKPQVSAELPFVEDFENSYLYDHWDGMGPYNSFSAETNMWWIGEAVAYEGNQALYISDDEHGETYHYETTASHTINQAQVLRKLIIPEDAVETYVSYYYQVNGEFRADQPLDYFWNDIKYTEWVEVNNALVLREISQQRGQPFYVDSNGWQRETNVMDVLESMVDREINPYVNFRFLWVYNSENGTQPPAAIDKVKVMASSCYMPISAEANFVEGTNNIELSWEPRGEENQWEIFVTELGEEGPEPEDRGVLVTGDPSHLIQDVEEGKHFVFYVRAVCGETLYERSFWRGPVEYFYSIDTPCLDITKEDLDFPTSDSGDYIICDDTSIQTTLKVDYGNSRGTDDYYYKAIDYVPLYPFVDQGRTDLTGEDQWSEAIALGFNFCFFDQVYDKVLLTTNGVMSFSIEGETVNGQYAPGSESSGVLEKELINGTPEDAPFLDAIFGAMQDLDLQNSPVDASVNYKVYGEFPCRAFVFNTYHVALKGEAYDVGNIEGTTQTSQIVLYESTNTIEVYLKKRPIAASDSELNNRNSVIGIINHDGSMARNPFYRNTGNWRAEEEAWRFVPRGESRVELQWYRNGEEYATTPVIDVWIDDEVEYTAKVTYSLCEGNEVVLEENFNFIKEDFDVSALPTFKICSNKEGETAIAVVDINDYIDPILEHINATAADFTIEFYDDEILENSVTEPIRLRGERIVYVKVTSKVSGCVRSGSLKLIQIPPVELAILPNVEVCKAYVLPKVEEGAAFYTKPFGEGDRYETGYVFDQIGTTQLYVYKQTEEGCEGQSTFTVVIHEEAIAMQIENQNLECETFVLPQPLKYNRYFTRPHGQGLELQPGQEILMPMEIFIYAKNGSAQVECIDESSFKVNYDDCPLPKGISPNGDGLNESLDLSGHGISQIKIFNRDGVEVYSHGRGYKKQWYGQNKSGKMLPSGTYYYILTSHGKQRTGWIQLMY